MRKTQTYILKLWNDGKTVDTWRACLENVQTHERQNFGGLEQMLRFLKTTWAEENAQLSAGKDDGPKQGVELKRN